MSVATILVIKYVVTLQVPISALAPLDLLWTLMTTRHAMVCSYDYIHVSNSFTCLCCLVKEH